MIDLFLANIRNNIKNTFSGGVLILQKSFKFKTKKGVKNLISTPNY